MTTEQVIQGVLDREGGYVDRPADRGGPTKYGITIDTLSAWRETPVTKDQVAAMSEAEARAIYRERYIEGPGFHLIGDDAVRVMVVDMAVNHGVSGAVKMVQQVVGVEPDGVFGGKTLQAVEMAPQGLVGENKLAARRLRKYASILVADHSQREFAAGWMNRVADLLDG